MKKFTLKYFIQTLFFLVLGMQICFAQWIWQNPLPQGNSLLDVCFIDANTGFAVGWYGTILKTTDAGNNWMIQSSGTIKHLNGVYFIDAYNGIAVGQSGTILKTTDSGNYWIHQSSGTTGNLEKVRFTDANNGTIVGYGWNDSTSYGVILRTIDGGKNWISQYKYSDSTNYWLHDVCFTDENNGIAIGGDDWGGKGFILRTTDGGNNWSTQLEGDVSYHSVCFTNANTGMIVGEGGRILRTIDGGTSWIDKSIETDYPDGDYLYGVCFVDDTTGWITGYWGIIYKTTDGGDNWIKQPSGITPGGLMRVIFTDLNTGTIVGDTHHNGAGIILRTTDGGNNWISQTSGTTYDITGLSYIDINNGTAVGWGWNGVNDESIILRTTDGGKNWVDQLRIPNIRLSDVCFTDTNNGTAVGGKTILRTTDGGNNWISKSIEDYHFDKVRFADSNTGWIISSEYMDTVIIFKTTDGGNNWIKSSSGITKPVNDVCFIDTNTGIAVGEGGIIQKTTDGGKNWHFQSSGVTNNLNRVYFIDSDTGWVFGGNWNSADEESVILRTTDGGNTWINQKHEINNVQYGFWCVITGVYFSDSNHGTIVTGGGIGLGPPGAKILRTTDGGETWETQFEGTYGFNAVSFVDANNGIAVGYGGAILRTTNGGVTFVEEQVINETPSGFLLSQNYPNPFNIDTKIKYSVTNPSKVFLKVFDIHGKVTDILVNEEKPAGTYEVTWHARNLPGGIYFYQLNAGGFIETKKMLLHK